MKPEVKIPLMGAALCALLGSFLGTAAILAVGVVVYQQAVPPLLEGVLAFATGYMFALAFTGPFGLVVGGVGGLVLVERARRGDSLTVVRMAAAIAGALLGLALPLVGELLGWNPLEGLAGLLPISAGVGSVCALILTAVVKQDLLHVQARAGKRARSR